MLGPVTPRFALSAGASSVSRGTVAFSNSNNVSFGLDGSTVTATASYPAQTNQSLGLYAIGNTTQNSSSTFDARSVSFNGLGNITVGFSNNSVQISGAAAAAQSNQTLGLYASSNTYLTSSGTIDARSLSFRGDKSITVGISGSEVLFSVGAYITTADLSANSSAYLRQWALAGNNTAGTTSSLQGTQLNLSGGNGVTLSGNSNTVIFSVATNYQSQGAYLTTAALSGDTSKYFQNWKLTGNTAGTTSSAQGTDLWLAGGQGLTISGNSNSLTFSVGSYITTADLSANSSTYFQKWSLLGNTAGTTTTQSLSILQLSGGQGITLSGNSNTIVFSVGSYITTADLSQNSSTYFQKWSLLGNTAGTTTTQSLSILQLSGGQGITLSGNSNTIVFSVGSYITTARGSTDALGLNTAGTNVTWTANSSGLSINAGGYAGTQVGIITGNASITLNTNGMQFNGSGLAGTNTGATNCSVTVNSSGVSVSVNPGATIYEYNPPWMWSGMNTTSSLGQNTQYFQPFDLDQFVSAGYIGFYISLSASLSAGNSTGTCAVGAGYAIYTRDMTNGAASNTLSLLTSYNMTIVSMSMTSNTAFRATHYIGTSGNSSHSTSQYAVSNVSVTNYLSSTICGLRPVHFPISSLMTPGRYWLGFWVSTVSGNAMTNNVSVLATTLGAFPAMAPWGVAQAATNASFPVQQQGWGSFSAAQSTWPNSIAWTSDTIRGGVSQTFIPFKIAGYNTNKSQI